MRRLLVIGRYIFVRTTALLGAFTLAGAVIARFGDASLAAHQIAFQLWIFLALLLDAIAIAGQVLVGRGLGAGESERAYAASVRMIWLSVYAGIVFAAVMLALHGVLPWVFTSDDAVVERTQAIWLLFALMQPLNGAVFALDGILIGASDGRFLMWSMVAAFAVCALISLAALVFDWGIVGVWAALFVLICVRLVLMGWRFAGRPLAGYGLGVGQARRPLRRPHPGAHPRALAVPERAASVAEREPVDVDEIGIVLEPLDDAEERDVGVPIVLLQDRERDARIAPHVLQALARDVHVQQHEPVLPVVPGGDRVGRAVGSERRDDGWVRLAEERVDLRWDGWRARPSLRAERPTPRTRVPVALQARVGLPERHRAVVLVGLLRRQVGLGGGDELLLGGSLPRRGPPRCRAARAARARCRLTSFASPKWISASCSGARRSISSSVRYQPSMSTSGGGVGGSTVRLGWIRTPAASPA